MINEKIQKIISPNMESSEILQRLFTDYDIS